MKSKDTIKNESKRYIKSTTKLRMEKKGTWNSRFSMINDIGGQFEHDTVEKNGILNVLWR